MDPHSPNKLIATKCCFLILGDDTNFLFNNYFFVFRFFFVFLFLFVFINFYKNYFIYLIFFFMKIMKIIFFFPCFGMLRYVPGFIDAPFTLLSIASSSYQVSLISRTNVFNSSKYTTMIHVQLFQRPVNNSKSIFCSQLVENDIVNVL